MKTDKGLSFSKRYSCITFPGVQLGTCLEH